jgi:hypothetical protein
MNKIWKFEPIELNRQQKLSLQNDLSVQHLCVSGNRAKKFRTVQSVLAICFAALAKT